MIIISSSKNILQEGLTFVNVSITKFYDLHLF